MPREPMYTPVEELPLVISGHLTEDHWKGVVARVDAVVGEHPRLPGTRGATDPGSEGRGLAKHVQELRRTVGRMPGTLGVEDEGDGIAAHVFYQRRETKKGNNKSTGALISAAVALLLAAATLIRAEARAIERSEPASHAPAP